MESSRGTRGAVARIAAALVAWGALAAPGAAPLARAAGRSDLPVHVVRVRDVGGLRRAVAAWRDGPPPGAARVRIVVAPGTYAFDPVAAVDPRCGNCDDPRRAVPVTTALRVRGRDIEIVGDPSDPPVFVTRAGYGVWFDDCRDCALRDVVVTGGERDTAAMATDAAVVVQRSRVTIEHCVLRDNVGRAGRVERLVSGIMGVCVRDGSDAVVRHCEILGNSWDGVAVYRDSRARIERNVIDGVEGAGGEAGGGRGVGVGVTWDGRAIVERNLLRRYWKGIGAFVDADVVARENIVERMRAWGMTAWDADRGRPCAVFERNIVYDCGAFGIGITITRAAPPGVAPGRCSRNVIVHTAQNPRYDDETYYGIQCALALHAVPPGFVVAHNVGWDNRRVSPRCARDVPRVWFWRRRRNLVRTIRNTRIGVHGRRRLREAFFFGRYGRL